MKLFHLSILLLAITSATLMAQDLSEDYFVHYDEDKYSDKEWAKFVFGKYQKYKDDINYNFEWIFEFADKDSVFLVFFMEHLVANQKKMKYNYLKLGDSNDNSLKHKLEGLHLVELIEDSLYTENTLLSRIKSFRRLTKKSSIELTGVGFVVRDEPDSVANKDKLHSQEILKEEKKTNAIYVRGIITDSKDNKKIPFVSVGVINSNLGTMSNQNGHFSLEIPQNQYQDTLTIASIGYKTLEIPIIELDKNFNDIKLKSKSRILEEVLIESTSFSKQKIIGVNKVSGRKLGFVTGKGMGAEVARLMDYNGKQPLYLNKVGIYVKNKTQVPFKLLVNVYLQDSITGMPSQNLMKKALLVTSQIKEGWLSVGLSKQQILVVKSFFVSFQWINEQTKNPLIALKGSGGYQRSVSLGKWIKSSTFSWAIKAKGTVLE